MMESASRSPGVGALLGALTSLPLIALSYLGMRLADLPFVPFDLFEWVARVLPGAVLTAGIEALVQLVRGLNLGETSSAAKVIEQVVALGLVVAGGALVGTVVALVTGPGRESWRAGLVAGGLLFLLVTGVEFALGRGPDLTALLWLAALTLGWGTLLGHALDRGRADHVPAGARGPDGDRRAALTQIGGAAVASALAVWGIARLIPAAERARGAGRALPGRPPAEPSASPTPRAAAPSALTPAPGTRPAITPTEDFYRIDINLFPPQVNESAWMLRVDGLFTQPRPLSLDDLMAYPAVDQPITLACISNPIGGDLISTSIWTGARLRDVLGDLGMRPEAQELAIESADGFYESVPRADIMDPRTLLVYGMDGATLPAEHGFPLRIYIPNRYGMKQPKWITRITAIDHAGPGYWVERGWSAEARPHIVSIIDAVATEHTADGFVPVGGIAWAGDRGIRRVEVQVDREAWREASLLPPPGPLTWVRWRYDWPLASGRHTFRVRAVDGTGALQVGDESPTHPDGATGYYAVTVTV